MSEQKRLAGAMAHVSGLAAEDQVAELYTRRGGLIADRRWRGMAGEIDLVVILREVVVFVEVKRAKTHAIAAERVTPRQVRRLMAAAGEYLAETPLGLDTETRFDVALVDATGRIELREAAFP